VTPQAPDYLDEPEAEAEISDLLVADDSTFDVDDHEDDMSLED